MTWLSLTGSFRKTKRTPSLKRRPLLALEALEDGPAPVVGNKYELPTLIPGSIYDGVVMLTTQNGNNKATATGTLLNDGLHILTAAHVLKGTPQTPPGLLPNQQTVTFQLVRNDGPGGIVNPIYRNISFNVPVAEQIPYRGILRSPSLMTSLS